MKAMKVSICAAVTALALSLSAIAPSCAGQDEASRLNQESKELYRVGKYAAALPLAQQLLAIREKEFGPDGAMVALLAELSRQVPDATALAYLTAFTAALQAVN
ncbi:hypothetical protein LJR220_001243 [Bradyrhizobium sp. LjRoot220]|uniref:hypothetical protein n=1 Tax=Bradyrhizobium sp. LjRoot220 TaxID=3342284 RepID=UPI003ECC20B7